MFGDILTDWLWISADDAEACACSCTCGCTCPGGVVYSDDVKSTKKWQDTQTDEVGGMW